MAPDRPEPDDDEPRSGDQLERNDGQVPLCRGSEGDGNRRGQDQRRRCSDEDPDRMLLAISGKQQRGKLGLVAELGEKDRPENDEELFYGLLRKPGADLMPERRAPASPARIRHRSRRAPAGPLAPWPKPSMLTRAPSGHGRVATPLRRAHDRPGRRAHATRAWGRPPMSLCRVLLLRVHLDLVHKAE